MSNRKRFTTITAAVATAALASQLTVIPAYAQQTYRVTGKVFLDTNGNGINDE